jgi:hypothetical protein
MMLQSWLPSGAPPSDLRGFHFGRPDLEQALNKAFESGRHVLVYGAPNQGKTTLVRQVLAKRPHVILHSSRDCRFSDLSRNLLLSLGCSVRTEQKNKRRISGKAEINFKWPFISAGGSTEGGLDSEQTFKTFTAEIDNPNDVCHLLREMGTIPILIIEHLERLRRTDRELLVEFLRVSAESKTLQCVLIASSLRNPLEPRERLELSRHISLVSIPLFTARETEDLVNATLSYLACPPQTDVAKVIYDRLGGSLEATLDACSLVAAQWRRGNELTGEGSSQNLAEFASKEFQDKTRDFFLSLIQSIIDEGWIIDCYQVVDTSLNEEGLIDVSSDKVEFETEGGGDDTIPIDNVNIDNQSEGKKDTSPKPYAFASGEINIL